MFCVVDLETTSSNVNNALILTGTFLAVDKDLNLVSEKRIRCRPFKWDREADEASRIHRITRDMTQSWEPLSKQLPDLFSWFKEHNFKHFVCHAKRDMFGKKTTFDHAVMRLNLFPSEFYWPFVDTFNERNILSTHSLAMYLDKHYNFEKRDLKSVCKTLGVTLTDHHDDRADAIACYEVFKILYPKVDLTDFVNWDFYKINADDSLIKRKTRTKR